jgi:penicillin-binding protein 1A
MVVVEPSSRHILALVGSYEAVRSGLDRATHSHRQPGSSFKPVVFGYGIHTRALTAASMLGDPPPERASDGEPSPVHDGPGPLSARAAPVMPPLLREALAKSDNAAAVWALRKLGPRNVVEWAGSLGIRSKLGPDDSLALGAYELSPRELAGVFTTFAAGGIYEPPVLVTSIVGPDGVALELPPLPAPKRVMDEAEAYVLTDLLTSVVERGTGRRAQVLGRPIAGKTGTSNDSRDAWFAGYSADLVCVVWTGYDDGLSLGPRETGATVALPAFVDLMRVAHTNRPKRAFAVPAGVVRARIDPRSGLLAREDQDESLDEVFVAGTEPTEIAPAVEDLDAGVEAPDAAATPVEEPPAGDVDAVVSPGAAAGGAEPGAGAAPPAEPPGARPAEPPDAGAAAVP